MAGEKKYYIHKNDEQIGPLTISELSEFGLFRDTLVWHEGLDKWKKAYEVPELFETFGFLPPEPDEPEILIPDTINDNQGKTIVSRQDLRPKSNGLGKTSLVFGILSAVFSSIGITFFVAIPFMVTSMVCGILGLILPNMVKYGKGSAIAGLVLTGLSAGWLAFLYFYLVNEFNNLWIDPYY